MQETLVFYSWVGKIHWRRDSLHIQYSWVSLVAQLVKNLPAMWETWVRSLGWEDPRRRERLPTPVFWPGEFQGLYSPRYCIGIWERTNFSLVAIISETLVIYISLMLQIHCGLTGSLFPHGLSGNKADRGSTN